MIYSGKMEAFDGVITVTSISYKESQVKDVRNRNKLTICISVLEAALLTSEASS